MSTNPMHQFEVYKIGPEINLNGISTYHLQMQVYL